ncbi:hypothetical protein AOQ84DRAFT_394900 [Glonium stellatum]|uniref:NADPH--cytochrome P450 reductase n=1 Tax=Glonium stellatum TaxID=574774 RepID=A0A8E2JXV6_9PEZI|nr:hypothetical protein AOQ84DRAFT_394900 [Glonium stellatum]
MASSTIGYIQPTSTADVLALSLVATCSTYYLLKGIVWDKPDPYRYQLFERPQLRDDAARDLKRETRNIAKKLEEHGKNVVIFWGSQSGTAEGLANRLGRECHLRFGLEVLVADLSDYDPETIALIPKAKLAIFIMSTYGEGDPSDNTAGFWDWIHNAEGIPLPNLRYMAFGLGNSNYNYYNRVIDVTADALNGFGATPLMPVSKADDAQGATEEDFMAWKHRLFIVFQQDLGFDEIEIKYMPTFSVTKEESLTVAELYNGELSHRWADGKAASTCSPIRPLRIQKSKELFVSSERNCLQIELDLSDHSDLHYKTGDHLAVWPMNPDEEIERLLKALGISRDNHVPITVRSLDPTVKAKIPSPTTIVTLLSHYLEICAPVSREAILNLAQFAPSPKAKAYLLTLGGDKDLYTDLLTRNYLTMGRILLLASPDSTWSDLPLSYIIESLPQIQPRYYSISSSSVISPRRPSITAVVAKTPLVNAPTQCIFGLTTNYLLALSNSLSTSNVHPQGLTYQLNGPSETLKGGKIFAHLRKSKFKLPALASCPLIMVGAGTGLAPFMAFLTERQKLMEIGKLVGEMLLFFGCRDPEEDFIYRTELEELERLFAGKLRIVTAFSRVPGKSRIGDVLRLIEEGANFYICGRANMAKEVERAVGNAMRVKNGWDDTQLNDWSRKIKGMRKLQEDVWG